MVANGAEVVVKLHKEQKYSFIGLKKVIPDHGAFVSAEWQLQMPDGEGRGRSKEHESSLSVKRGDSW